MLKPARQIPATKTGGQKPPPTPAQPEETEESMGTHPDYATRLERLLSHVSGDSLAVENGFEIPREPARYLAVEKSDGQPIWAINSGSLGELAGDLDMSETRADQITVCDLDTGIRYLATGKTMTFLALPPAKPDRIDVAAAAPAPWQPPQGTTPPTCPKCGGHGVTVEADAFANYALAGFTADGFPVADWDAPDTQVFDDRAYICDGCQHRSKNADDFDKAPPETATSL